MGMIYEAVFLWFLHFQLISDTVELLPAQLLTLVVKQYLMPFPNFQHNELQRDSRITDWVLCFTFMKFTCISDVCHALSVLPLGENCILLTYFVHAGERNATSAEKKYGVVHK